MEAQAGRNPGDNELHQGASLHQKQHRCERRAEPAREHALPRVTVQVGYRVAHNDQSDERHEKQHHHADDVDAWRQGNGADANGRPVNAPWRLSTMADRTEAMSAANAAISATIRGRRGRSPGLPIARTAAAITAAGASRGSALHQRVTLPTEPCTMRKRVSISAA